MTTTRNDRDRRAGLRREISSMHGRLWGVSSDQRPELWARLARAEAELDELTADLDSPVRLTDARDATRRCNIAVRRALNTAGAHRGGKAGNAAVDLLHADLALAVHELRAVARALSIEL